MLEKLTEYLGELLCNSKEAKELNELWEEKRKFLHYIYLEYCRHLGAILITYNSAKYKNRLEDLNCFPFPANDEPEKQWAEVWLKTFYSNMINDNAQLNVFKSFSSQKYEPPEDLFEIMAHLQALTMYYHWFVHHMPLSVTVCFDLAMTKIVHKAWAAIEFFNQKGRHKDIYRKGIETKKSNSDEKAQQAIEAYYRIPTEGMSLHKIAKTIESTLIKNGIYPEPAPGQKPKDYSKSIKRYLMRDGKIKKDLKKT